MTAVAYTLPPPQTFRVLDIDVSAVDIDRAARFVFDSVAAGRKVYVTLTGVHGVMESHDKPVVRQAHLDAGLVCPDGMPLVYIGWLNHLPIGHVRGPDLMLEVFARSTGERPRHFLYGGGEGVSALLRAKLSERFPQAQIVADHTPPFGAPTQEQDAADARLINGSGADIVWVGLSTPKQELWMQRMRPLLDAPVLLGVGAAFDFHAGLKAEAPRIVQGLALEWLFRLLSEPRRLWRRYLKNNPRFVALMLAQYLRGSRRA